MSAQNEKSQRRKVIYSEEFQDMLERLEEEDYADRSGSLFGKKNRLCLDKVKALEKHFEEENKLQPDRKVRIAEEVGLEPRQVAIWFQNRRARWKTKQLEREYDHLRASYDALKNDYGSLEQEKIALLNQLKDLKAKIEARNTDTHATNSIPTHGQSTQVSIGSTHVNVPLLVSSESSSSATFDPFPTVSSSTLNEYELCKAYQDQLMRMDEMEMPNDSASCNFFSVDQAPYLQWYPGKYPFN